MVIKVHTALYSDSGTTINQFLRQAGLWEDPRVQIVEREFGEIYSEEWATHQPLNRMPYLVDEEAGVELHELRIMCAYIATKCKSELAPAPADTMEYWNYQKMLSVLIDHFTFNANVLVSELIYGPMIYQKPADQAVITWHETDFKKCMKGYDRILAKQKWLLGDRISLIDIFHANMGDLAQKGGAAKCLSDGTYPNVARWWKALLETPAYQAAAKTKEEKVKEWMEKNKNGTSH